MINSMNEEGGDCRYGRESRMCWRINLLEGEL